MMMIDEAEQPTEGPIDGDGPAPTRPLSAAETLARALGTTPTTGRTDPPEAAADRLTGPTASP